MGEETLGESDRTSYNLRLMEGWWSKNIVLIITALIALVIGYYQIRINTALKDLEDSVEIYGYTHSTTSTASIILTNVGKIQIYITSYSIDGAISNVDNALIPAGQQQNAWYVVNLPATNNGQKRSLVIKLEDQLQRYWESDMDFTFMGNGWESVVHKIKRID